MNIKIGSKLIGPGLPCFVIAEIGINHNGSMDIARKLIDVAVDSGCDAVKFQKREIDLVYSEEELKKARENPFGPTNGHLKRGLEFGPEQYRELDAHCKKRGIVWFASSWDPLSLDLMEKLETPCHKVPSALLTDSGMLKRIRATGKPVILSTGMSTLDQIKRAVSYLDPANLVIMHCVATYPTKDDELNLKVIHTLEKEFPGIPIGYSGHGYGTTLAVCAVAMGACSVERHITLDRTMWGSDQAASLEPAGLSQMIKNIRRFESALGTGEKVVLASEMPILAKLRKVSDF